MMTISSLSLSLSLSSFVVVILSVVYVCVYFYQLCSLRSLPLLFFTSFINLGLPPQSSTFQKNCLWILKFQRYSFEIHFKKIKNQNGTINSLISCYSTENHIRISLLSTCYHEFQNITLASFEQMRENIGLK